MRVCMECRQIACTPFIFAATTAALPMDREMRSVSASVQVKVYINFLCALKPQSGVSSTSPLNNHLYEIPQCIKRTYLNVVVFGKILHRRTYSIGYVLFLHKQIQTAHKGRSGSDARPTYPHNRSCRGPFANTR